MQLVEYKEFSQIAPLLYKAVLLHLHLIGSNEVLSRSEELALHSYGTMLWQQLSPAEISYSESMRNGTQVTHETVAAHFYHKNPHQKFVLVLKEVIDVIETLKGENHQASKIIRSEGICITPQAVEALRTVFEAIPQVSSIEFFETKLKTAFELIEIIFFELSELLSHQDRQELTTSVTPDDIDPKTVQEKTVAETLFFKAYLLDFIKSERVWEKVGTNITHRVFFQNDGVGPVPVLEVKGRIVSSDGPVITFFNLTQEVEYFFLHFLGYETDAIRNFANMSTYFTESVLRKIAEGSLTLNEVWEQIKEKNGIYGEADFHAWLNERQNSMLEMLENQSQAVKGEVVCLNIGDTYSYQRVTRLNTKSDCRTESILGDKPVFYSQEIKKLLELILLEIKH